MRKFTLSLIEPSEPAAGAILVTDQDNNDIAEFYHSEHATVGQSYDEALTLAALAAAAPSMAAALLAVADGLRSGQFSVKGMLSMIDVTLAQSLASRSRNVSETQPRSGIHKSGNSFPVDGNETGTGFDPDADFLRDRQQDAEMRGDL
jgi:hypothetical protein